MSKAWPGIVLLLFFCWETTAQEFRMDQVPPSIRAEVSQAHLGRLLDSASQHSFVPLHAKIYDTELGTEDAQHQNGDLLWHLKAEDLAIKAYLKLKVFEGDTLYIYNKIGEVREKLHSGNHFQANWISSIYEDDVYIRYRATSGNPPEVKITNYSLQLKKPSAINGFTGFGSSASCEINVACEEGQDYRNVATSIVRIGTKLSGYEGWCTGTLVNNTANDYKPYIITAEHCGIVINEFAATDDLENWEFYFGYASETCENPPSEASINFVKLIGSSLLARSHDDGGEYGSDFMLLELTDSMGFEQLHNPYFAGWNRTDNAPERGVTIHHPQGDIKKISTFDEAFSSSFGATAEHSHWEVYWSSTTNGRGVTELGSSGCPLLDHNGLVTGVLTGGAASCTTPQHEDFFGKFSYSWDRNGPQSDYRLKPWLDPVNSEVFVLQGTHRGDTLLPDTNDFAVVPVPVTNGILKIRGLGTSDQLSGFEIYSMNGSLMYKDEKATVPNAIEEIDVGGFSSGVYILRIVRTEGIMRKKIMVIN